MKTYSLSLFFLCLLFTVTASGQSMKKKFLGIGASYGFTNYLGDLDDDFTFRFTEYGVGVHVVRSIVDRWQVRATYFHGYIEAADREAVNTSNYKRNLGFRTSIDEISVQGIFRFLKNEKGFQLRTRLTPYVFAGIALFHFNPQANLDGKWYDLQTLGTEGQWLEGDYPDPYKLWQASIPFGGGLAFKLSYSFDIAFEMGLRKTFTDYIDDVSTKYPDLEKLHAEKGDVAYQLSYRGNRNGVDDSDISFKHRGNPGSMDLYAYTHLSITYYFGLSSGKKGMRGFFRDEGR